MRGLLDGKVAIVTGAGSGIGAATAQMMAREGAAVVTADLDPDTARATAEAITGSGGDAVAITADIGDEAQIQAMVRLAVERYGGLDVLHNNAALIDPGVFARDRTVVGMEAEIWDRVMAVNVRGPMLGCKYAIPEMLERGGGSIIMTTSVGAQAATVNQTAYGVSKGAVDTLVRYVAVGYGKQGIRCNGIAPGVVMSPSAQEVLNQDLLDVLRLTHPSARLGEPEDIAAMAVFLASDLAEYVNGTVIPVHGGMTGYNPHQVELWSRDLDTFPAKEKQS